MANKEIKQTIQQTNDNVALLKALTVAVEKSGQIPTEPSELDAAFVATYGHSEKEIVGMLHGSGDRAAFASVCSKIVMNLEDRTPAQQASCMEPELSYDSGLKESVLRAVTVLEALSKIASDVFDAHKAGLKLEIPEEVEAAYLAKHGQYGAKTIRELRGEPVNPLSIASRNVKVFMRLEDPEQPETSS